MSEAVNSGIYWVYVTTSCEEEARSIARALVSERLAACANVMPSICSIYEWQAQLMEEQECVLLLKTQQHLFSQLKERVLALHSYDCPCVIALPAADGHASFFDWIKEQTQKPAD